MFVVGDAVVAWIHGRGSAPVGYIYIIDNATSKQVLMNGLYSEM